MSAMSIASFTGLFAIALGGLVSSGCGAAASPGYEGTAGQPDAKQLDRGSR